MPTVAQRPPAAMAPPLLWRVTDRHTFEVLRQQGRRARRGPLTLTWVPSGPGQSATPARAAFAVSRAAGGAVVRNRIRRRLRAALRHLAAQGRLPAGTYLVGGGAELAQIAWSDLLDLLTAAIDGVQP